MDSVKPNGFGSFLFLQGPASMFFSQLAAALRERGNQTSRINFNGGDRIFWKHPGAVDFLGTEASWPSFLVQHIAKWETTDLVLLGDCRPLHRTAIDIANAAGITTHIFEEGYIRPNWITLERSGVNGFSSLPRLVDEFLVASAELNEAPPPVPVPSRLARRALDDVKYSISTMLMAWHYRNYKRHWPYGQMTEYGQGARRLFGRTLSARSRQRRIAKIVTSKTPYYVLPMQIDVDSQIRFHSQFDGQKDAIRMVIRSFSLRASQASNLVITEHPLETSPVNWRRFVREQALEFGVSDRVKFFVGGSPNELLIAARGIIVVNSTTGHQGLELGVPVIALSKAVFNLQGVTFQGGLDRFWEEARPADPAWIEAYRKVVIHRTQINGGFFSKKGITLAVANSIELMEAKNDERVGPVLENPSTHENHVVVPTHAVNYL